MDPADGPRLQALRGRLRNALELGQHGLLALPNTWPTTDHKLQFYIYSSQPLPTGRVMERIEGPVAVARVGTLELTVELDDINALPMVIEREPPRELQQGVRRRAETLLLDVVSGRADADDARDALRSDYCELLDDGAVGKDLRGRAQAFVEWLSCDGFGGRRRIQIQTAQ